MKLSKILIYIGIMVLLYSCISTEGQLTVINSKSFPENQIKIDPAIQRYLTSESDSVKPIFETQNFNLLSGKIDDMFQMAEEVKRTKSDSLWLDFKSHWESFRTRNFESENKISMRYDSLPNHEFVELMQKWAELNKFLLKFSGEVKFADALETILFQSTIPILSNEFLKSILFTHIDDQIFIHLLVSSSIDHHHTTGGTIHLIQETNYPSVDEMILKCVCADTRFLDVYIRIPTWAVNPTVSHGNVKYVAHPGEYCQISRKWNDGDEILVKLKN